MIRRLLPAALIAAAMPATLAADGNDATVLSFFRGNGEGGVFLAASEDGHKFRALNGDKPVFAPPKWPDQSLTRDPSVVFHDGTFHMVWTSNWKGRVFGYAHSPDLVDTSRDETDRLEMPGGLRHGTVFTAPRDKVGWLRN